MHFFRFGVWEIVVNIACFRCEASAVYGNYNGSNLSNFFDQMNGNVFVEPYNINLTFRAATLTAVSHRPGKLA